MPIKPKSKRRPWECKSDTRVQGRRVNANQAFYQSRVWRTVRANYLAMHPFCECDDCKLLPVPLPANVVDHITPINRGGDALSEDNFQAMNARCHNKKSAKESHQ